MPELETAQDNLCPACERPLPRPGAPCRFCAGQPSASFHVRPLFLGLVVLLAAAFCAATVFAARFYRAKQRQLGIMWFARGQAALAAGQPQTAIQDFRNALYYSREDPACRLRLAQALADANRLPEAQSYLLSLWQDEPGNSTVNLQLARLAARQSRTQSALRYYHGAIYGFWSEGDAPTLRRQTRLELIHYLLALRDFTQADAELIALTPELPRPSPANAQVGELFLQAGDPERALQQFEQALRSNPRQPAALRGAGQAAFQLARYRDAAQYLERAQRLGPRDPQSEELLATSRLVLEWNPYAKGINAGARALRIAQAFRQARRRLDQCAARVGISLAPELSSTSPPRAAVSAPAQSAPPSPSGLMARIMGKIRPGEPALPLPAAANNSAAMQQLHQQVTRLRPDLRPYRLQRDPQLADLAMGLVTQIETVTAQQCGAPKGPDLALLLLARQAEER